MCHCVVEAASEVLHQGLCELCVVVERDHLVQDGEVSCLTDVGIRSGNQPERVVVEAASHRKVAALGQRLVLVVGRTVGELRSGDVQDPVPCAARDHVYETQQVLAGVPEAHSASHSAFEIAGASGHVERDHALVLVPRVDHAVHPGVAAGDCELAQELVPGIPEDIEGGVYLGIGVVAQHHLLGLLAVDGIQAVPLLCILVLDISESEHHGVFLSGIQGDVDLVGSAGSPAVGYGVAALALENGIGSGGAAVGTVEDVHVCVESVCLAVAPEDAEEVEYL